VSLESAAGLVVDVGVVVVAWGDCERRYMCHSVRKSFMSGLYGIHVDAGTIDTGKTLGELGIDDEPTLTEIEKRARIVDLLCARSGVYKLAAYEPPQNPKPARGTHEPGTHWCYNNFDFNTLCTILEQETGLKTFEQFDEQFARPLGMQDYRVRDGYYHYELDKSIHPAYPFRMSARDSARYGLLFLYEGQWGDERVLSEDWIARSTRSYSDAGGGGGYAYMWWTFATPETGVAGYSARGVGGQMIAVLPKADLVVINRTDTYEQKNVGTNQRMRLIEMVMAAKTGAPNTGAEEDALELVAMPSTGAPIPRLSDERLASYVGQYEAAGIPIEVGASDGRLFLETPTTGAFSLAPVEDTDDVFLTEDVEMHVYFEEPARGERGQLTWEYILVRAFGDLRDARDREGAQELAERAVEMFPMSATSHVLLATAFADTGDMELARELTAIALELDPANSSALESERALGP
jgi:CubicO group peptidase (beta-lactamase class C family)